MKILKLGFLIFILGTILSCSNQEDDLIDATIEGYDLRLCPCCGGLFVRPSDANGEKYQWYQKNQKFEVNEKDVYPLKVKIKYHHLAETCVASDGEIEITELEKVK